MSLSKHWELVKDREAWHAAVQMESQRIRHDWETEQQQKTHKILPGAISESSPHSFSSSFLFLNLYFLLALLRPRLVSFMPSVYILGYFHSQMKPGSFKCHMIWLTRIACWFCFQICLKEEDTYAGDFLPALFHPGLYQTFSPPLLSVILSLLVFFTNTC